MDPHTWPFKSRTPSTNMHSATMLGYRMLSWRPAWGDERYGKVAREGQGYPCYHATVLYIYIYISSSWDMMMMVMIYIYIYIYIYESKYGSKFDSIKVAEKHHNFCYFHTVGFWSIFTFILSFRKSKHQIQSYTSFTMDDFKTIYIYENLLVIAYFLINRRIYLVYLGNPTFSNMFPRARHVLMTFEL